MGRAPTRGRSRHTGLSTMPAEYFTQEKLAAAIQAGGKVVVDFTASWCGPCKMIAPFFQELADKYGEGYTFCKIDVDEEDDCAAEHGISAMPTFLAFKGGAKVGTLQGAAKAKPEKLAV